MSLVTRLMPDNPVLTKELRVRMRGARAYWILFGYLGFLSLVLLFQYGSWISNVSRSGGGSEASRLGGEIFLWIMVTQVFLVLFITPAITSGSITIENEQRTMDMLTMTRLSRSSIIVGKLLSAVSFTALLLVSSLPLISICFMLGSVDPAMVISSYMMMLMGSFLIGAMGLMWSSIAKTTTQAVMYTYASLFCLFVFGGIGYGFNAAPNITGTILENLFHAVGSVWFGERFLGLPGPNGMGFAALCLLGGWLFAAIAMARLDMFPERKAKLLRTLSLVLIGVELLGVNLWWLNAWYNRGGGAIMRVVQPPIAALVITVILLMLLVPTFATGELLPVEARRFGRYLLWGWTPKGLAKGKLASGLPFVVLTTLFALGLYIVSFAFVGKASDFAKSGAFGTNFATPAAPPTLLPGQTTTTQTLGGPPVTTTMTANGQIITTVNGKVVPAPPPVKPVIPADIGDFPQAALCILVSVVGFSLFCMFLSVAFRNRWVAWILAYILLLVVLIGPELSHIPAYSSTEPGYGVNLYYLNPIQPIIQMADPNNYYNKPLLDHGWMLLGTTPMWKAVSVVWLLIGILSFLLTLPFIAREKQKTAAIPYEEMVTGF